MIVRRDDEIRALETEPLEDPERPLILQAGERRSYNANTIFRHPEWRREDDEGALKINPTDARSVGLSDGGRRGASVDHRRGARGGCLSAPWLWDGGW